MSHKGDGCHGIWFGERVNTYARAAQLFGHDLAWRAFIQADLTQLPPVPNVVLEERRLARRALDQARKTASKCYTQYGTQLDRAYKRGLLSQSEYYRLEDWAYTLAQSAERVAALNFAHAMRQIKRLEVSNA